MDDSTLHELCVMGEIEEAESVEEASEEAVLSWFDRASKVAPKDLSKRIDAAKMKILLEA